MNTLNPLLIILLYETISLGKNCKQVEGSKAPDLSFLNHQDTHRVSQSTD